MIRPWNNVRCCFKDCWVLESLDFVAWSSCVSLSALWEGSQLPAQLQYYTTEETFSGLPSVAETLLLPFKKTGLFVCLFVLQSIVLFEGCFKAYFQNLVDEEEPKRQLLLFPCGQLPLTHCQVIPFPLERDLSPTCCLATRPFSHWEKRNQVACETLLPLWSGHIEQILKTRNICLFMPTSLPSPAATSVHICKQHCSLF